MAWIYFLMNVSIRVRLLNCFFDFEEVLLSLVIENHWLRNRVFSLSFWLMLHSNFLIDFSYSSLFHGKTHDSVLRFSFRDLSMLNFKSSLIFLIIRFTSLIFRHNQNFTFWTWLVQVIHELSFTHDLLFTAIVSRLCFWNSDFGDDKTSNIFSCYFVMLWRFQCFSLNLVKLLFWFWVNFWLWNSLFLLLEVPFLFLSLVA